MNAPSLIVSRYHDFSAGHRVIGHEHKCRFLHGHNYRVHFNCTGQLDPIGRVIDFSQIKERLCLWVENNWDHRFLIKDNDPWFQTYSSNIETSLVRLPFNPTAENLAQYLGEKVAPRQLKGTGITCTKITIEETRKCSATWVK